MVPLRDDIGIDAGLRVKRRRLVDYLSRWKLEIDAAERRKAPADSLCQVRLLDRSAPVTAGMAGDNNAHLRLLWRPDASAGPNPGGAFYGPPNVNVGYINPRWARAPSLARVSVRLQRCEFSADVAAARQPRPAGGITCRRPAFVSQ
jgi:hypothetical protein